MMSGNMAKHRISLLQTLKDDLPLIAVLTGLIIITGFVIITNHRFQLFGGDIARAKTTQKVVALTLDDGPNEKHIDDVLGTLDTYQVKATFFLIGKEIKAHENAGRLIAARGHEIGNHGYTHRSLAFLSPRELDAEIKYTDSAIRELGYTGPIPFRPPYGHKFISLPLYMNAHNRQTIMWSVAPENSPLGISAAEISERAIEATEPGSIIILHVMEDHREESRKALKTLIPGLQAKGYHFVTVSELLKLTQ